MSEDVEKKTASDYLGYSLFNDIEAAPLRVKNRGTVLANMIEAGQIGNSIKHDATAVVIGYFREVPDAEKGETLRCMNQVLAERGISITDVSLH